jgi:hypothetical protein
MMLKYNLNIHLFNLYMIILCYLNKSISMYLIFKTNLYFNFEKYLKLLNVVIKYNYIFHFVFCY